MSTKREYLLQKGRQLQALTAEVTHTSTTITTSVTISKSGKQARELAKVRELCPNGTEDDVLLQLLAQTKGDQAKMEQAVSELWENHRGGTTDEWATVEKKGKKKTETTSFRGARDGPRSTRDRPAYKPQDSDAADPASEENDATGRAASSNRGGRGNVRGRGAPTLRGGRGGRGRGTAPRAGEDADGEQSADNTDPATTEGDNGKNATNKNSQRKDAPSSTTKHTETQPAVATPPPVIPGLTGAWTKKPNLVGLVQPPKPAAPANPPAEKPASTKPAQPSAAAAVASPVKSPKAAAVTSPSKASPAPAPTSAPVMSSPKKAAQAPASPKKVASPKAVEKIASPNITEAKPLEAPSISAWGSLDVSTTTIGDWSSTTTTEKKTVQATNAWARGSPITTITTEIKSPATAAANPVASPRDLPVENLTTASGAASPKYLKLGRWDTGASANLALQFGSFSLSGVEQPEPSSPRGWATTTAASTSTATKTTTKVETANAWGTQAAPSPKKKAPLSPAARPTETEERKTGSAPPGLSVESGRLTPKSAQSPRTFAPSAPSPASLPKPDEVKRSTPTRAQGGFQGAAQSAKIGSGSSYAGEFGSKASSSLYQGSYGQYSMGIGGANNQSNTPKSAAPRSSGPAPGTQSPTHATQQPQAQYQAQPQQAQQQQKSQQQQPGAQSQASQQHQHHPHAHQQGVPHHQAGPPGYHPHYAPPPPPGMAMPYNPYNYASYYQGYGYYQNPQYAQYSPRAQYPPRGSVPYGVEGPVPGFANAPNVPYQDQHLHDYPGAIPQGFGEISNAYLQQQSGHHHQGHQQGAPQSHGKSSNQTAASSQQPRSGSGFQGYQSSSGANAREHAASSAATSQAGGATGAAAASYGQHYGWASYGAQPMGGWGHMMPQGYQQQQQQNPSQQQQQQPHQGSHHQQSYRQYGSSSSQGGNASSESANVGSNHGSHAHAWSS